MDDAMAKLRNFKPRILGSQPMGKNSLPSRLGNTRRKNPEMHKYLGWVNNMCCMVSVFLLLKECGTFIVIPGRLQEN